MKKISWFLLGMIFYHIFISLIFCTFVQFNFFIGWFLELFYLTRFYPVDFQKQIVNWSTVGDQRMLQPDQEDSYGSSPPLVWPNK